MRRGLIVLVVFVAFVAVCMGLILKNRNHLRNVVWGFLLESPFSSQEINLELIRRNIPRNPIGQTTVLQASTGKDILGGVFEIRTIFPTSSAKQKAEEHPPRGKPVFLYLHGGGYVICGNGTHDQLVQAIADKTNSIGIVADYRLAPEAKFPIAVDDSYDALKYVIQHASSIGGDPNRIFVGGDSAGGVLTGALAYRARDDQLEPPLAGVFLLYPRGDTTYSAPSYTKYNKGYGLTIQMSKYFNLQYTDDDPSKMNHPWVSLLRSKDFSRLPPYRFYLAEYDILIDNTIELERRWREAGNKGNLLVYNQTIHGFASLPIGYGKEINHILSDLNSFFNSNSNTTPEKVS